MCLFKNSTQKLVSDQKYSAAVRNTFVRTQQDSQRVTSSGIFFGFCFAVEFSCRGFQMTNSLEAQKRWLAARVRGNCFKRLI